MAARMLRAIPSRNLSPLVSIRMPLLAMLLISPFATAALAQAPAARGRGQGMLVVEQVGLALEGLNLSFEQRNKIDEILAAARTQARGMAGELAQADAPTRRGRARGLLLSLRDQILPILTPDQARSFNLRLQDLRLGGPNAAPAGQRPLGQVVEQLYDFVTKLELDEQQKPKVEALFNETRQKLLAVRQNPPGDGTAPGKIAQMVQDLRDRLTATLTETQRDQLRTMIAQNDAVPTPRGRGARGGRAGRGQAILPPDAPMQPNMADNMMAGAAAPAIAQPAEPQPAEMPGVPIGQPAPDFTLNTIDGRPLALSSYKGKVVLLVFGSYSSPSFRQRAPALEQLRSAYGPRINVIVIYTRESHPVGEWNTQRNKDEGIAIEQAKDIDARIAEARKARTTLGLTAPFVVDTLDNATATAYAGFSNAAVLIGRDGTVLHQQKWFEPYALRRYIDDAVK